MIRMLPSLFIVVALFGVSGCTHYDESHRALYGRPFPYPPAMPGAEIETYKVLDGRELNAYVFSPTGHRAGDRRPAMVLFFGGGWRQGSPNQFYAHCEYFRSRRMVVIAVDYRVARRDGVSAVDCVRDGKSAIRWVRANARRLGVDPRRVAAGGGSAGGHVAACTALVPWFDEPDEDLAFSSKPDALVLFNPVVILAPTEEVPFTEKRRAELWERLGVEPILLSPFHQVAENAPPTIIFHGTSDTTVPFPTVAAFAAEMKRAGNRCELVAYEDQGHGFFNYNPGKNEMFSATVAEADRFLDDVGFLKGRPMVKRFLDE